MGISLSVSCIDGSALAFIPFGFTALEGQVRYRTKERATHDLERGDFRLHQRRSPTLGGGWPPETGWVGGAPEHVDAAVEVRPGAQVDTNDVQSQTRLNPVCSLTPVCDMVTLLLPRLPHPHPVPSRSCLCHLCPGAPSPLSSRSSSSHRCGITHCEAPPPETRRGDCPQGLPRVNF